jgi:hypothetical protein
MRGTLANELLPSSWVSSLV